MSKLTIGRLAGQASVIVEAVRCYQRVALQTELDNHQTIGAIVVRRCAESGSSSSTEALADNQ